jgi:hypothetical protein
VQGHPPIWTKILAALAFLAPCARSLAADHVQFFVPAVGPMELRFAAIDPARGPIDQHRLLQDLTAALQARSNLQLNQMGKTTTELSGLRTHLSEDQSQIVFEYVHLARNKVGDEWGETLTIPVPYRIQKSDVLFLIRLEPSRVADVSKRRTPGITFLSTPKLGPIGELIDDFTSIIAGAESVELRHDYLMLGQTNSAMAPQGCIAKLDFALGRYAYGKNEERTFNPKLEDVFLFRTAHESFPLKVVAVNDRGHSRIFYEARLPFELRADGTVKGYDLADAVTSEINRMLQDPQSREAKGRNENTSSDVIISERR